MAWGMNPAPNWSPSEKDRLRKLVALGYTVNKIAEDIGRSRNGVIGMIHRLGLKLTPEAKARDPGIRNTVRKPKPPEPKPKVKPEVVFFLNGEPMTLRIADRSCARCAVRESQHHLHGCGQFAAEVRVRIR